MITQQQKDFIAAVAGYVAKYAPQYGISVNSPIIAQAILESAWGTSDLAQHHNYFGLKCRASWKGPYYSKKTKEEYTTGTITEITASFRAYPDMESGIKGYFEFLFEPGIDRYDNLKGVIDPARYCELIKADGYATSSTYVSQLTNLIKVHDLTEYDKGGIAMPKLFIVCGHGGKDSGASGNGYSEAERVRALAAEMVKQAGNQVTLGDPSYDWYSAKTFATLPDPGCPVIELHMDSATASARGGHVIIKQGFAADAYDNALANYIRSVFPGRSSNPNGRNDLQNVNLCAKRGINYRLLEVCFITSKADMDYFNANIPQIAAGILKCFGITTEQKAPEVDSEPQRRRDVQVWAYDDTDSQKWWIRDNGDGTVSFRNASCWDWISDPYSSDKKIDAMVYGGQGGSDGNQDPREPQKLIIEKLNDEGVVKIHPACAKKLSLDVKDNSSADGTVVQWHPDNESEAQKWIMYHDEDKSYRIVNVHAFKALGVPGGGWY